MSGLLSGNRRAKLKTADISDYGLVTDAKIANAISAVIDSAPGVLDTLSEVATAIGDNPDFATSVVLKSGSTMTGNLAMGSNKVTGLADGSASGDAVNKGQLDLMLPLAGGTMSGAITGLTGITTAGITVGVNQILNSSRQFYNLNSVDSASYAKLGVVINSSAAELNYNNGITPGTVSASKTVVADASRNISNIAALSCASLTLNSGAITSSASELNYNAGVTLGLVAPSKTVTADASSNIANINQITAALVATSNVTAGNLVITSVGSNLNLRAAGGGSLVNIDQGGFGIAGTAVTASASDLNKLAGITNGVGSASKALVLNSNSDIASGVNAITCTYLNAAELTATSGLTLSAGAGNLLATATGGAIQLASKTQISGLAPYSTAIVAAATINSSCEITSVGGNTMVIAITTANSGRCISRITVGGTVSAWQRVTLINKTSVTLILGHGAVSTSGALMCWWYELLPNAQIDLIYDAGADKFYSPMITHMHAMRWRALRWSDDQSLAMFVSTAYTYTVKINFYNSNTTINGVSGWENISAGTNSGTGWSRSVTGSNLNYNTPMARWLASTESSMFQNFEYNSSSTTWTFSGLTSGNLYCFCMFVMVFDTSGRYMTFTEDTTGVKDQINMQQYASGSGSDEPATVIHYVWKQQTSATTKTFTLSNPGINAHWYALCVINLGAAQ
jgi:hypothetical protein